MRIIQSGHPEVLLLEPRVFGDARGFFMECYSRQTFAALGITADFVQDNHTRSTRGVLLGLHCPVRQPQGKLVGVVAGEVYDVAVDLRRSSPDFGRAVCAHLSAENRRMDWIPPGFAHGFLVLSEFAEFLYKTTDYYAPEHERSLLWNGPVLAIAWPMTTEPILSDKDRMGLPPRLAEVYP
jgi:dTDP-4-dehydrorhamnose 3,5-epimerase